ncbi:MAG: lycopene cyclase domain-containing protein [Bacteroidota bacterium]
MKDGSWTYALVLILSLAYPLAQSFERRLRMWKRFRFLFPGILLTAIPFLIWDVHFARTGIWGFNPNYVGDLFIGGLPIEEWLFFLVVPYACFFIYEVLRYFVKKFYFPAASRWIITGLLILSILSLPFIYTRTYTLTAVLFVIPFLALQLVIRSYEKWLSGFLLMYLVSAIPFLIVNGILTSLPVVWYNNAENLGLRIFTIPVEDLIYLMGMLLPAMTLYQYLLGRSGKTELRGAPSSGF